LTRTDDQKQLVMSSIIARFNNEKCLNVERMLSIMSNPIRFHILCALAMDSFTVSELVYLTKGKVSNISQQLRIMTLAGYLTKERKGKQIYYSITDLRIVELIQFLEKLFTETESVQIKMGEKINA
jgi:DNA-binding transcriptional ArsR family regulator